MDYDYTETIIILLSIATDYYIYGELPYSSVNIKLSYEWLGPTRGC
jgi:hypothetical protein